MNLALRTGTQTNELYMYSFKFSTPKGCFPCFFFHSGNSTQVVFLHQQKCNQARKGYKKYFKICHILVNFLTSFFSLMSFFHHEILMDDPDQCFRLMILYILKRIVYIKQKLFQFSFLT